jgi:hypothetical protein
VVIGTYAVYVGASVWYGLNESAVRSVSEAMEVARREGLNGQLNELCVGAIKPEYFAQLSQVIPLLLVALGLERRFFERLLQEPVQRTLTLFTVLLLCAGEAIAIATLPSPNQGCGRFSITGRSTRLSSSRRWLASSRSQRLCGHSLPSRPRRRSNLP